MSLHSSEIARLAKVLARLFPEFDQRQRLASKAEVGSQAQLAGEVVEAWRDIVHCAQVEGTLEVLLKAALSERPQDRELRRIVDSLHGERKAGTSRYLVVAIALLVAGVLAFWLSTDSGEAPRQEAAEEEWASTRNQAALVPATLPAEEVAVVPEGATTGIEAEQAPAADAERSSPDAVEVPEARSSEEVVSGRCSGSRGELVGYFYANNGISAEVGQPYTMRRDVNVRADYPRKENQWSASQTVVCVLQREDVLVLSAPPFDVDGGKVWVPLHAGDLQL